MHDELKLEACPHSTLRFHSGGYYVGCPRCGATWVAVKSLNDTSLDYDRRSPLAGMGTLQFVSDAPTASATEADVERETYESAVKGRADFRSAYREARESLKDAFRPTDDEIRVIDGLGADLDLSPGAVIRQALRFYQLMQARLKAGETFAFSGDAKRAEEFAGPALSLTRPAGGEEVVVTDDMLNAGQERLCQIRASTDFDDEAQAEIFKAMYAALSSLPVRSGEVERLREALTFYADFHASSTVGDRARAALATPQQVGEEELAECIAAYEEERRLAEAGECTNTWGCKDPDHRGSCGFSSARAAALTPTEGSGS